MRRVVSNKKEGAYDNIAQFIHALENISTHTLLQMRHTEAKRMMEEEKKEVWKAE